MYGVVLPIAIAAAILGGSIAHARATDRPGALAASSISRAEWPARIDPRRTSAHIVKAQVLLKRARFSPGVVDGRLGENFAKALRAFQEMNGLDPTGELDEVTWAKLAEASDEDIVRRYEVGEEDTEGPFVKRIPKDFEQMAELDHVGYRSPRELLAEKFHMSENLLTALNGRKNRARAGTEIIVIDVPPLDAARPSKQEVRAARLDRSDAREGTAKKTVDRIVVSKSERSVRVFGTDGRLIAFYPASIGSEEKPAPSGTFEVRSVAFNPVYRYDPKYAFKGQKAEHPVEVAPGPNNPVGLVWIGISADGYGIHGTPDPERVSKTQSNGCIRLTNWDAVELARMVHKGTPVEFID